MNRNEYKDPIQVEVIKDFRVSSQKVFDAWLNPRKISKWMFGPDVRDEEIVSLENNPIEGGTFSFVVRRDNEELDHRGTYREIERPKRLTFTWGVNSEAEDESVVIVTIEPTPRGCRLRLVHKMDTKWEEYKDRTREGWNLMLEKLKGIKL